MLTAFGVIVVTFMMVMYALERRDSRFILPSPADAFSPAFLAGVWPFGVVEVIWAGVAVERVRRVRE